MNECKNNIHSELQFLRSDWLWSFDLCSGLELYGKDERTFESRVFSTRPNAKCHAEVAMGDQCADIPGLRQ